MEKVAIKIKREEIDGKFYAYVDEDGYEPYGIKGCPMGRGGSFDKAVSDLIYRIKIESHIDVVEKV